MHPIVIKRVTFSKYPQSSVDINDFKKIGEKEEAAGNETRQNRKEENDHL